MGFHVERVATPATYELVSEQIRRAIHIGTYLPGDKLPAERQLAEQMGVSRTTVREALRVLEGEGYVESHRGAAGGIVVLDQTSSEERIRPVVMARMAEFEELFDFRIAVEGAAVRLAAVRRTETDLKQLQKALDAMAEGWQTARFRAADSAFHLGIADAAIIAGPEAYPPTPTTTSGLKLRTSSRLKRSPKNSLPKLSGASTSRVSSS